VDPTLISQGAIQKLENNVRITTVLEGYSLTRTANLPIPVEFKEQGEIHSLLFKFHPYFDGLLGIDFLTDRKAKINIEELNLETPFTSINIITEINRSTDELFIQPQSKAIIKLPVDLSEGDFLCNSLEIDSNLSVSGLLEITNSSETGQIICLDQPLNVEPYNKECYDQINGVTLNPSYQQFRSSGVTNSYEHIPTDHLNDEEKQELLKICKKISGSILRRRDTSHILQHS